METSAESISDQNKRPGRPKRGKDKVSKTAKENILAVFTRLGGTAQMARWATKNQTDFYKLYARLIPTELVGNADQPLTLVFRDPTQRPDGYQRKSGG